jgi:hypothetical protein
MTLVQSQTENINKLITIAKLVTVTVTPLNVITLGQTLSYDNKRVLL